MKRLFSKIDRLLLRHHPRVWIFIHRPLFQYRPDDPTSRIRKHYRRCRQVMFVAFGSAVLMMSEIAMLLILGPSTIRLVMLGIAVTVSMLSMILHVCLLPLMDDAEKELKRRGIRIARGHTQDDLAKKYALKMMGWVAVIIAASEVMR